MSRGGEPPSTSTVLGRLIGENARERRARYKALKESGRSLEDVAVWPSTESAASAEPVASTSKLEAGGEVAHAERTAHLLLRVLGLCFVVPLMRIDDAGIPGNTERHGITVLQALETLESMIQEQPGTLEDVFQSKPGGNTGGYDMYSSTTLDLWFCPRMLVAAAVLSLRASGVLRATSTKGADEPGVTVAAAEADHLRRLLLDRIKSMLRCALLKAQHLETVRAILWEFLVACHQALVQVDDPLSQALPFRTDFSKRSASLSRSTTTEDSASLSFTSFFTSRHPHNTHLTPPKPGQRPPGEGIARLWMPEDQTSFELNLPVKDLTAQVQHCLSRTLLFCSVDVIISLAAEFPAYLDDIGQAASKSLFINWQHDLNFRRSDLKARILPPKIVGQRYEIVQHRLQNGGESSTFSEREFFGLLAAQTARHFAEGTETWGTSNQRTELSIRLRDIWRMMRTSRKRLPVAAWNSLRRLAGTFLSNLAEPLPDISEAFDEEDMNDGQTGSAMGETKDNPSEELARKLCAYEGLLSIIQLSALPNPLTSLQEKEATQLLCGEDFDGTAITEEDEEEQAASTHPWLPLEEAREARRVIGHLVRSRAASQNGKERRTKRPWAEDDSTSPKAVSLAQLLKAGGLREDVHVSAPEEDVVHASGLDEVLRNELFICAQADCVSERQASVAQRQRLSLLRCSLCDNGDYPGPSAAEQEVEIVRADHVRLVSTLYGDQNIKETLFVGALNTIARQTAHYPVERFLEIIDAGSLEALVRQGLTHAHREIRLAAGRLAFAIAAKHISTNGDGDLASLRRRLAPLHDIHESLLAVSTPKVKETLIISLGNLGRINKEEILENVLLQLVLQLNSTVLLQSCAYLQITQLAAHHRCSTYALLSPYFAVISPPIVERMTSAPSLFLEVLKLTNQNQAKFLQVTLDWTLPRVIAARNTKALDLMVSALGTTIPKLCLEQAPAILKQYLLLQPQKRDKNIQLYLDTIRRASDQEVPLKGLYRSYIGEILGHLVACLGDEDRRPLALDGLRHIQHTLTVERNEKSKAKAAMSGGGDLSAFLREEILGILAWLNDDLMSVNGKRSPTYKAMVARSIGVFIEVVGSSISMVAPQIMATLSSTLQVPELRTATLQSWQTFMTTLRFDDVGPFIGQTTAALLSEWSHFSNVERKVAGKILNYLVVENAQEMRKFSAEIPDMEDLATELPDVCRKLRSSRQDWSAEQQLQQILERVADENASINLRSLHELKGFLQNHRRYIQTQASGTAFAPIVGTIITALLGTLRRSDDTQLEMRDLCLECLGMLGAVDPDRLELPAEDSPHKLLQNFEDRDETIDFAVHLIRDILVSAFRATSDTKHQSALAYAIQELLRFCGFTSALLRPNGRISSLKVKQRWNDLPPAIIDTVAPLLDSKYSITHGPATSHDKPFYQHSNSYREWIEIWANHLMQGAKGQDAETVFGIFRVLIRHHDLDITQHILPHAVLHNLISGTDQQREELRAEFVAVLLDQVDPTMGFSPDRRLLCAQTVFGLMDHMSAWLRLKRMERSRQPRQRRDPIGMAGGEDSLTNIESVIASISQELMARAALYCRAYARSLLNFEQRLRTFRSSGKPDGELQTYYENLHTIYASLDEPDGMEGISTCIISPSLEHQIREHESTGRWTSAQSCWEVEIQSKPDDASNHVGLLRCLRNLGHYDTMRTHVRGALSVHPQWEEILAPFAIEGACILGDWDEAEQILSRPGEQQSPEHAMARVLLAMAGRGNEAISDVLQTARRQLGKPILAAGRGSYPQIYDSVLQLHVLHEASLIEELAQTTDRGGKKLDGLLRSLQARLDATLPSFRIREPLLSLRRSAFSTYVEPGSTEPAYKEQIAAAWVSTCKIARKAGHTQTAYSAVLQAMVNQAPFAFVQRAKLLADAEQPHAAMQELTNALQTMTASMRAATAGSAIDSGVIDLTGASHPSEVDQAMYGKAVLLKARLFEATGRFMPNDVIEQYKESAKICKSLEKAWYCLGRYYDTLGGATVANMMTQHYSVCRYFCKSASLGTKFFYRTLPRLLTIWLDAGEEQLILDHQNGRYKASSDKNKNADASDRIETFSKINDMINRSVLKLQPYQWLAVFPQLVSRIVHKNEAVWAILQTIIAVVIEKYPHQAMWGMVAGFNSTDSHRKRRANAIVDMMKSSRQGSKEAVKIIQMSQKLAHELLVLCDYPVQKSETTLKMETAFPALASLAGCGLILPLQSSVTVSLPANNEVKADHYPFPPNLPLIQGFESTIEIMNSLQKPRKIVIIGSDGKHYPFLCKPKDDLRKDARLMEFDSMINKLLQSNSESRKRHLLIRTYAVVTLNEECGLIEWVPNTVGLRHILHKLYSSKGIHLYSNDIRVVMDECRKDPRRAGELFEKKVLVNYPPVFHEWFLNTFPEPAAWLKARLSYARTCAVMSMVGFVLGLGDRHGENILFDSVSGDTVHVDLNCLFEKGYTFEIPEQVPFRLTRNMIDAMGVTGYEGVFRRAAELTMGILRSNKDSLMSVLEAMVHDPLVEWAVADTGGGGGRSKAAREAANGAPKQDPRLIEARKSLDPIARKLDGTMRKGDIRVDQWTAPLGNNNLVDTLTREAASNYNLSRMYVGWSSWL
ncbi:hypothetical protein BCV69DRAFT_274423 [Microstroma glucosiphilum]|uniref:non-specific serine/threonine protein kinase n=1 Tax=Pseudomicrostroma glucosiphilum TaxID=1684307 RepID=A0A316TZS2_9BASI|nr:hypothetical protein BCV69DRAFT_274423 [Pseudomicrostroma glucosiphilum]PWN18138.1 hypothetical protein BCV69DRAFT_274423 [Pseudomicrostroma glucosiphilum]